MKKNTAQVWDKVWSDPGLMKDDELIVAAEKATVRWKRLIAILKTQFPKLKNLKVIEIGAGSGTYAALLAQQGCSVSLLDYSPKALERAKEFFRHNHLKAQFIQGDALQLPKSLKNTFDISISIGLNEHFRGEKRLLINKAHLDVLRKGGVAVIVVPNSYNLPYRIYKCISELTGTWKFGEEYPYTRTELVEISQKLKAQCIALFGDDFYTSLKFLLPANFLRRFFKVGSARNLKEIVEEKGTFLDNDFGYSLVLVLKK
jgi:SAM-dependent methyltransferase